MTMYISSSSKVVDEHHCSEMNGQSRISQLLKKICSGAGVQNRYTKHSGRTTEATRLFQSGTPENVIMERSGHRNTDVLTYNVQYALTSTDSDWNAPTSAESDWNAPTSTESDWNAPTSTDSDWNTPTSTESDWNAPTSAESDWKCYSTAWCSEEK